MTHFIIRGLDHEGALPRRLAAYDAHKAYLAGTLPVTILVSGPLVGADNETAIGSFFLVEAPDRAAGIWRDVEIHAFLKRQDNR